MFFCYDYYYDLFASKMHVKSTNISISSAYQVKTTLRLYAVWRYVTEKSIYKIIINISTKVWK